ncbi:Eco57I restriction-modification methylase domain-containing protein [Nostoc sp.]|uniref:Eco57I restriction-modification methylase domain-containing protein n=1 Tax=Nostoc sp. TaxID=1180 RepID=UPI003FA5868B
MKSQENKSLQEQALLSLKIVDPACGSGHFLLAAARRVGKELAKIRTGEAEPGSEPLKLAIRDVIQNCIYGVDLNPLAVDLCKVALWIEGFSRGFPLNFLDHRIKCGNSLVGVMDLSCLNEGIPDEAYKAVTGDDKTLSTQFKKRNKKERENKAQLSIDEKLGNDSVDYAKMWRQLGVIPETTPQEVKYKQKQYQENLQESSWWLKYSACNLWTAAFFMPLTEHQLQLLPTTETLNRLKREQVEKICKSDENYELRITNYELNKVVVAANKLAEEKHFFHWCLEFPEVFEQGGFNCVLGNPPWERIKLQEKEFFASQSAEIANAINKAAREKLIKELHKKNPELAQAFEDAKHDAEAQGKFIRESGRFPLTAVGDINTYAIFAETTRKLISPFGRISIIVPTGIATDEPNKYFFAQIVESRNLVSLYDFENREHLFSALHTKTKFCLLTMASIGNTSIKFCFLSTNLTNLKDNKRVFGMAPEIISLLNPNTQTCPLFRSCIDAELTNKIYQRVPVMDNEKTGNNPWRISLMSMFHMANDSNLFHNKAATSLGSVYEAKMFYHFDHRWATYRDTEIHTLVETDKKNSNIYATPRYWIDETEVENRLRGKWNKNWLIGCRKITDSRNERTAIFSIVPKSACGDSINLIMPVINENLLLQCLLANLNSLIFDFIAKQKIGGMNFSFFILKQLPVLPPELYTAEDIKFISDRVLELVYTAWDMQPFAKDMGYDGEPFIWNPNRRALLRAELDAYYAKLYGLTRDELRYILDPADVYGADFPSETLGIVRLVIESGNKAGEFAKTLINKAKEELTDTLIQRKVLEFIETIVVYKFPNLSREEIETMLNLNLLKQTKVYQEAKEEGKLETKLKMIPILLELGLSVQQIAERLELDVEEVRKAIQEI